MHFYNAIFVHLGIAIYKNTIKSFQPISYDSSIKPIQLELSKVETQMDRWLDAFEKGAIDSTLLSDRIKKLTDRKTKLENCIKEFEDNMLEYNDKVVRATEVYETLRKLPSMWNHLSLDEKRGLIVNTIHSVKVFAD